MKNPKPETLTQTHLSDLLWAVDYFLASCEAGGDNYVGGLARLLLDARERPEDLNAFRQAIELTQNVLRAAGQVSKPETPDVQRLKSLQDITRLKLVPGQQAMAALEYPPETVPVWIIVLDRFRFVPFASDCEAMTWLSGVAFALQEWDWRRGQWHSEINPI